MDGDNPFTDLFLSYGVTLLEGGEGPVRFRGPNIQARRYRRKTGDTGGEEKKVATSSRIGGYDKGRKRRTDPQHFS